MDKRVVIMDQEAKMIITKRSNTNTKILPNVDYALMKNELERFLSFVKVPRKSFLQYLSAAGECAKAGLFSINDKDMVILLNKQSN